MSFELLPAGTAILTLDANKLSIKVKAKTADGSSINVKGCTKTILANDTETTLTATDTKVILKGKITELNVQGLTALWNLSCSYNKLTKLDAHGLTKLYWLSCYNNKLTELNVKGCTSLKNLDCSRNKLDAEAMKEILYALPTRQKIDRAEALLYTREKGVTEDNYKNFTTNESLKEASKEAKRRKWRLKYKDLKGDEKDI